MNAFFRHTIAVAALGAATLFRGWGVADAPPSTTDFSTFGVVELEQQLANVDNEIQSLARLSLRNEVGAIGHRSVTHDSPNKTCLRTELNVSAEKLCLAVVDNGLGLSQADGAKFPASLQRRAQLLCCEMTVDQPADRGTGVRLTLPIRKRRHC